MIRLTSSNYYIWKPRMEDILYCKDLYAPIDGVKVNPKICQKQNERSCIEKQ